MTPSATAARLAAGCALLFVVTAGCAADPSPEAGPTSEVGPPSTAASMPASASPTPGPACPVTTDVLFKALQANPGLRDKLAPGITGLKDPVCVLDWAAATTVVTGADAALVVFRYHQGSGTWAAINGGTSGACNTHGMPEEVKNQLPQSCRG
jgi:hypothetical protein